MVERREKEVNDPACKNAEKLNENADSYLTETHQPLVRLPITGRFRAADTTPGRQLDTTFEEPKNLGHFYIEAGSEKNSSKENKSAAKTKDSPRHCKNEDEVEENEESEPEPAVAAHHSYLSEVHQQVNNTHHEGRMLITGQFKFMDHRDTPEHYEFKDLTGQQLDDDTFEELNSLGYFYIEAGPIAHSQ